MTFQLADPSKAEDCFYPDLVARNKIDERAIEALSSALIGMAPGIKKWPRKPRCSRISPRRLLISDGLHPTLLADLGQSVYSKV